MTQLMGWRAVRRLAAVGAALAAGLSIAQTAVQPPALTGVKPPDPSGLADYVVNKPAAIALGKALFWDMNVGSDGRTACATCHFHAGADTRSKNVVSPGAKGFGLADLNRNFNAKLTAQDFPFHRPRLIDDNKGGNQRENSAVASSPGVFKQNFIGVNAGSTLDSVQNVAGGIFNVGGISVRQVEPRNTPTVINAAFNLRNFWDGRAQTIFNGVNPWGNRDPDARVYKVVNGVVQPVRVAINDASLASQAAGPPLSDLEMSAAGRSFPELGRKMLALRPLSAQAVDATDSVLGVWRHSSGVGLSPATYRDMVTAAFGSQWWNGTQTVVINGRNFSQIEANFSLFWGLALQLYQATLVSDQTPYDRFVTGTSTALTTQQIQGLGLFMGKGRCVNCHGGATFTNAAIRRVPLSTQRMSNMLMGNGATAVYDEGFYNIGVTRSTHDVAVGGRDPWGKPLSFSGLARDFNSLFAALEADVPNVAVSPTARIAVTGAFKTPTLRNVELTAPYFHNGGSLDLHGVVRFYDRGGNFAGENRNDLDADIQPLGLTPTEEDALVAFLKALTDERVRRHAAPFDHPELFVPDGHVGDTRSVTVDGSGLAMDAGLRLPAVGSGGYAATAQPRSFEQGLASSPLVASQTMGLPVQVHHSGMCLDVAGGSLADGARLVQNPCNGSPSQQWFEERVSAGVNLRNKASGKCADVSGASWLDGAPVIQYVCNGGSNQVLNWDLLQMVFKHSGKCLELSGGSMAAGAGFVQSYCETSAAQRFTQGVMLRSALFGGTGGDPFTDTVSAGQSLTAIVVRHGSIIDGVQAITTAGTMPLRGGATGSVATITLAPGETLVGVDGVAVDWYGSRLVGRLTFVTSTGRRVGPYGSLYNAFNQRAFSLRAPAGKQVIGFHGRHGSYLDTVGLLYND